MTVDVKACRPWDSLNRAAQVMWENDCGCVPVVDESGRVVGMLTDRDVCMAAYTQGRLLAEMTVSSAMSKTVVICTQEDRIATAEQRMREHRVRRLAVVNGAGRIVGVLSLSDLARGARHERAGGKKKELSLQGVGETLGAICEQPHSAEVSAAEAWVAWTGAGTKRTRREVAHGTHAESAAGRLGRSRRRKAGTKAGTPGNNK